MILDFWMTILIKVTDDLNFDSPVLVITGFRAGESKKYLSFLC